MHVAVVGAGSLGRIFGVRLGSAGVAVDFVVRPGGERIAPLRIEAVHGGAATLDAPSYVTEVPAHADVVLVCVRGDQLGDDLVALLRAGPSVPVVNLAPVLPRTHARLRAQLGDRLVTAMSSITGYTNEAGVVRYWISQSTKTLLDEPRRPEPAVTAFVEALVQARIEARIEPGVHEMNAATAIVFLPLAMALDAAGTIDALLGDRALLRLAFQAMSEARALAERCGKVAPWVGLVTRFLGPVTIRMGVSLGRSRAPEALAFIEGHFGRKIHGQNLVMAEEACAVADEKGAGHEALDALLVRIRAKAA
jgi:2-dehydropantoate 2-reductase